MSVDDSAESAASTPLSDRERVDLVRMREEERLARDLYRQFHQAWGVPIFDNIAASEQRHYDAIGRLLKRYNVPDPSAGQPLGVYTETELQDAYDTWLTKGLSSIGAAYAVGVELETGDIADLSSAAEGSDEAAIQRVYENLRAASENHLRAFEGAISGRPIGGGRRWRRRRRGAEHSGEGCTGDRHGGGRGHGGGGGHGHRR